MEIKEGSFIVSDAHYSHQRPLFLDFLKDIHLKKLQPTQLILMGDIFDTLFGGIPFTTKINQEAVKLLNEISLEMEVVYLEGNHDFNLSKIFPHAKIFKIIQQPLACGFQGKKVMLAHGDFGSDFWYRAYVATIRNKAVLFFLNMINFISLNLILRKLDDYLSEKEDCKYFIGFRAFIAKRLANRYSCDYFVEGHFHQNITLKFEDFTYTNLGAFACNQRYFIVKSLQEIEFLEEKTFSKEI